MIIRQWWFLEATVDQKAAKTEVHEQLAMGGTGWSYWNSEEPQI